MKKQAIYFDKNVLALSVFIVLSIILLFFTNNKSTEDDISGSSPLLINNLENQQNKTQNETYVVGVVNGTTFIGGRELPKEIFAKRNLETLRCTETFPNQGDGTFSVYKKAERLELVDEDILAFLENTDENLRSSISEVTKCVSQSGKTIIIYGTGVHEELIGEIEKTKSYVGYLRQNFVLEPLLELPNNNTAYFSCREPLTFSEDGKMIIKCSGGNSLYGKATLYEVNFSEETVTHITSCENNGACE